MGPDQFTVEGPIAANALQAATVAPVAEEAWVDGAAPVYSSTDGKLHPTVVQPAGGAIVSVTGVAPIGVSPGVAPVVSLSGVVDVAHGGTSSSTGDASLLTNIPAAQLSGDVSLANVAAALAAGGGPVKGTVLTATTRLDAPTVGTSSATQHALPSGTADLLSADSSAVVTNKTISGSSNTLSNIGNSSLTNSSVTVSAGTGLAGGGAVALGSSVSLSLPSVGSAGTYAYPASVTTDAQGRVSAVTAGSAPVASVGVSSPITSTGGSTPTIGLDETTTYNWSGVHTFGNYTDLTSISAPVAPSSGRVRQYSAQFHGVDLPNFLNSQGVELTLCQDSIAVVKNVTGSSIPALTPVYVSGASGNVPTVAPAQADYTMAKLPCTGVTIATIADGAFGVVMSRGVLSSINTNSFNAGDTLYVDAVTPGALTSTAPSRPSVEQAVATVTVKGVGNGEIDIAVVPINLHRIDGTNQTSFAVGNGHTTGPMSYQFLQTAGTGVLQMTVTGNRTLTLPDTTDTLVVSGDVRLPPTPTGAGKIPYDTGSGYSETATGGSTTTVLHGGTTPAYAAVSLTADVSGTLPVSSGGTGQTSLSAHCVLIGEGTSGISVAAQGTAGQVLTSQGASADPAMLDPITGTTGTATLASTYTISTINGAYEDTGLYVTLPSAGTYYVWYQARSNINATTTAGAYILTEMYNATDATDVANSEQIGAYGTTISASYYMTSFVAMVLTVNASKVIRMYAKCVVPSNVSVKTINSDANGRSRMGYVKINYV